MVVCVYVVVHTFLSQYIQLFTLHDVFYSKRILIRNNRANEKENGNQTQLRDRQIENLKKIKKKKQVVLDPEVSRYSACRKALKAEKDKLSRILPVK